LLPDSLRVPDAGRHSHAAPQAGTVRRRISFMAPARQRTASQRATRCSPSRSRFGLWRACFFIFAIAIEVYSDHRFHAADAKRAGSFGRVFQCRCDFRCVVDRRRMRRKRRSGARRCRGGDRSDRPPSGVLATPRRPQALTTPFDARVNIRRPDSQRSGSGQALGAALENHPQRGPRTQFPAAHGRLRAAL